jgi:hypothetical protein
MNRYHVAIAGLALAVLGLGGALAFAVNDPDTWMHDDHHDGAGMPMLEGMAGLSMMEASDHVAMEAEMRAIMGDNADGRDMRSMDAVDAHVATMRTHMAMDSAGMMK